MVNNSSGTNFSGNLYQTSLTADGVVYADVNGVLTSTSAGTAAQVLTSNGPGVAPTFQAGGGGGGVTGPGSSTDRAIATWNGTGGTALFNNSTAKIDSTGRMTNSAQPCFQATLTNQIGPLANGNHIVIYDTCALNQGSMYNTGTGVATVPIAGKYLLNLSIIYLAYGDVYTGGAGTINVNGTPVGTWYNSVSTQTAGAGNWSPASFNMILNLSASDQVTVVAGASTVGGQFYLTGGLQFFSMSLLAA